MSNVPPWVESERVRQQEYDARRYVESLPAQQRAAQLDALRARCESLCEHETLDKVNETRDALDDAERGVHVAQQAYDEVFAAATDDDESVDRVVRAETRLRIAKKVREERRAAHAQAAQAVHPQLASALAQLHADDEQQHAQRVEVLDDELSAAEQVVEQVKQRKVVEQREYDQSRWFVASVTPEQLAPVPQAERVPQVATIDDAIAIAGAALAGRRQTEHLRATLPPASDGLRSASEVEQWLASTQPK